MRHRHAMSDIRWIWKKLIPKELHYNSPCVHSDQYTGEAQQNQCHTDYFQSNGHMHPTF